MAVHGFSDAWILRGFPESRYRQNAEQQKQVFGVLANNRVGVDYFIELISEFLNSADKFASGYKIAVLDFV